MQSFFLSLLVAASSEQCLDTDGHQCAAPIDDIVSYESAELQRTELLQQHRESNKLYRATEDDKLNDMQPNPPWYAVSDKQKCRGTALKRIEKSKTPTECMKQCDKTNTCKSISRGRAEKGRGSWYCVLFNNECKSLQKPGKGEWKSFTKAGCNSETRHGEYQSRVRFRSAAVQFPETCKPQTQTRACNMGTWKKWSGRYTAKTCDVITPAPTPDPVQAEYTKMPGFGACRPNKDGNQFWTYGYTKRSCWEKCQTTNGCSSFTFNPTTGFCNIQNSDATHIYQLDDFECWTRSSQADCIVPSTAGYNFTSAAGDVTWATFNPSGVTCAHGYTGTVTYTKCGNGGTAYAVDGCEEVSTPAPTVDDGH